jgi:hypothetical protein
LLAFACVPNSANFLQKPGGDHQDVEASWPGHQWAVKSLTLAFVRAAKKAKGEPKAKTEKASKKGAPKEKKAPNPYMRFCSQERPNIKKENPSLGFGDIGKALGSAWKKLTDAEKATYKE